MVSKIYACQKYMDIRNIYIYMHIYIYNMYIYIYICMSEIYSCILKNTCMSEIYAYIFRNTRQLNLLCRFSSLKISTENIFTRY